MLRLKFYAIPFQFLVHFNFVKLILLYATNILFNIFSFSNEKSRVLQHFQVRVFPDETKMVDKSNLKNVVEKRICLLIKTVQETFCIVAQYILLVILLLHCLCRKQVLY